MLFSRSFAKKIPYTSSVKQWLISKTKAGSWEIDYPSRHKWIRPRANLGHSGSLVVVGTDGLGFAAVRRRLHPTPALVDVFARTSPATLAITDLIISGSTDMRSMPLADRRRSLERLAGHLSIPVAPTNLRRIAPGTPLVLSPQTFDRSTV